MIAAIDAGNFETKYFDGTVEKKFPSALGGYREIKLDNQRGDYDFMYEFNGKKGFAGTLARDESYHSSKRGLSKVHEEALLRILLALHKFTDETEHEIVVGQPIETHTGKEKQEYKKLVQGKHTLTVNGVEKTIDIKRCEIAAEGVAVGLIPLGKIGSTPVTDQGTIRSIDIGSGTVNLGTIRNLRFVDLQSRTFPKGTETINESDEEFSRLISNFALDMDWKTTDSVRICGGGGKQLYPHLKAHFKNAELMPDAIFSNVRAFYQIARQIYG